MPDDRNKKVSQDRSRINIHEDCEVHYWSKKLGGTRDKLRAAVEKVGTSAEAVEREFKRPA